MTTKRKAEILRVLQEKYGVLKSMQYDDDDSCITDGCGNWYDYEDGIVLDALWEYVCQSDELIGISCLNNGFLMLGCHRIIGTLSEMLWQCTGFILIQKGELT